MHYGTRVSGRPAGSSRIIGAGAANEADISVARGAMDVIEMVGPPERADRWSAPVWIRTAGTGDIDCLSDHFGALSEPSRYDRFMGAVDNFAKIAFDCLMQSSKADRFTLVAEWPGRGRGAIVGEASYAFDPDQRCGEFAISVADRWQRQGLGSALLCALQFRAVSLNHLALFGESLKTNVQMKNLACKAGFAFSRSSDWRAVRFDKALIGPIVPLPGSGSLGGSEPGMRPCDQFAVTP
jgi:GNAT superfamily N-acetyltransferase